MPSVCALVRPSYGHEPALLMLRLAVRAPEDEASLRRDEQHLVSAFHPKFVYPIFGEEEQIYGYEDLDIQARLTPCDTESG